jgi:hydroxymethylpyrimidine pyrophosphatase-like HAD family hydrolase
MELEEPNMIFMVVYLKEIESFKENFKKYDEYLELKEIGRDLNYVLYYLNIKNVNKMYAVLELMLHLNYKLEDLIVVGDSIKDKEMLELDACTCAMINGEKEAKEAAKYISEYPNTEDGCVKFVNKVLNLSI